MVEFYTSLLEGIDLERFDYLIPILSGITIVLSVGLLFRALLSIFNTFFSH